MNLCRSMTGFGRGEAQHGPLRVTVELRAVNHRFADVQIKAPRGYASLQPALDKRVRATAERGRVEVLVRREVVGEGSRVVQIDEDLALAYVGAAERLAGIVADRADVAVLMLRPSGPRS